MSLVSPPDREGGGRKKRKKKGSYSPVLRDALVCSITSMSKQKKKKREDRSGKL